MSNAGKSGDSLVDEFVAYLNKSGFEAKFPDDIPEELRTSPAEYGMFHWQIRPASLNPEAEKQFEKLPQAWPRSFRSLIDRYQFCNFEVGPLMFFANSGHKLWYELSSTISKDTDLSSMLHKNGFLQFGLPHETNYDPVCFDMKQKNRADAPIVQLDHEEILLRGRIRIVQKIAPSFIEFIQHAITQEFSVH